MELKKPKSLNKSKILYFLKLFWLYFTLKTARKICKTITWHSNLQPENTLKFTQPLPHPWIAPALLALQKAPLLNFNILNAINSMKITKRLQTRGNNWYTSKPCPICYLKFHTLDKREQIHLKSNKIQKEARKRVTEIPLSCIFPLGKHLLTLLRINSNLIP